MGLYGSKFLPALHIWKVENNSTAVILEVAFPQILSRIWIWTLTFDLNPSFVALTVPYGYLPC